MNVTVTGLQARYGRPGQSAQRVVEGVVRQVGIEAGERGRQAAVQDNLAVVGAFPPSACQRRCPGRTGPSS